MNNIKDEFLRQYGQQMQNIEDLSKRILADYVIEACLKDEPDRQTFLVRSKCDANQYILKRALQKTGELSNEYTTLSALQNATFPKAITYFEEEQYAYLLREYVKGSNLFSIVEREGVFAEQKALEIGVSLCRSLSYLHHQSPPIIHRDIKPQNIILTPEGRPILIDMGTSRRYKEESQRDTVFMGTNATAAPEQYGFGQTDARCDIYATGILLIFLFTGGYATEKGILQTISKPLRGIISKCIAFDPQRRYKSANALRHQLERCLIRQKRLMKAFALAAGGLALFVIGAGMAWALANTGSARTSSLQAPPAPSATASTQENIATPTLTFMQAAATTPTPAGVQEEGTATFHSTLIEKAVRLDLGKKDGEPIQKEELKNVKQIMICGNTVFNDLNRYRQYARGYALNDETITTRGDISTLEDIRQMKNLNTLILDRQNISDISALNGLPLKTIGLCANLITDISALQTCQSLTCVKLEDNQVRDIAPLSGLKHLEILDIGYNQVTDLAPISTLSVRELYLLGTPIADYSLLQQLPSLELLALRELTPEQIDVVCGLTKLKQLTIYGSSINNMDQFKKLTRLEYLDLYGNSLTELTGVQALTNLRHICIGGNPLKDISPLSKMPLLQSIAIHNSPLPDLSVLMHFPYLRSLTCDREQDRALESMDKKPSFKIIIL